MSMDEDIVLAQKVEDQLDVVAGGNDADDQQQRKK